MVDLNSETKLDQKLVLDDSKSGRLRAYICPLRRQYVDITLNVAVLRSYVLVLQRLPIKAAMEISKSSYPCARFAIGTNTTYTYDLVRQLLGLTCYE